MAFSEKKKGQQDSTELPFEYYPEDILEFAKEHPKFAKKCEKMLTDIVLDKSARSFTGLASAKRNFLTTLVFEHFHLDMCTYGGKNTKTVTDVFYKEGCKVPDIMVTEVVNLIEKGIMSANNDDNKSQVFEATLHVYNVPKGTLIDTLKKFLINFRNEMYTEKGKTQGEFYLHFYKMMRAKDAYTFMRNTPSQFTNFELIMHKKQIGTNQETTPADENKPTKGKKKADRVVDDDGFTVVN